MSAALHTYHQDHKAYPDDATGLAGLLVAPSGATNWHGPYILKIGNDPWNHPYIYHPTPSGYVLFSMGPDGKAGTIDDILSPTMAATAPSGQ